MVQLDGRQQLLASNIGAINRNGYDRTIRNKHPRLLSRWPVLDGYSKKKVCVSSTSRPKLHDLIPEIGAKHAQMGSWWCLPNEPGATVHVKGLSPNTVH